MTNIETNIPLSVGILSWNRKDALEIALKSVKRQSLFCEIETIVMDSNSTDGSPEFVEKHFPWVRLIRLKDNPGLAEGRNLLVKLARAPIVFWIDDDCELVEDNVLETMLNFMNVYPQVGVLFAKILEGEHDTDFVHLSLPLDADRRKFGNTNLLTGTFASGGTCVRKDVFLKCDGYDKEFFRMNVENDFSYRLYDYGYCICYCPAVTIIHRPHRQGRTMEVIAYYSLRNKLWGFWRNLPWQWAFFCTMLELPMSFGRAVGQKVVVSWLKAMKDAFLGLIRRRKIRRPISLQALGLWVLASHSVLEWTGKIPEAPPASLRKFAEMEIKSRILFRLGIWQRNSYL
jgi:GT2 family glycosyltransferase